MQVRGNQILRYVDRYIGIPLVYLMGTFRKSNHAPPENPSNILMVKLSALGDTILAIPAIRAVRRQFPKANIIFVGGDTNQGVLESCPYIDQIRIFRKKKLLSNSGYFFNFVQKLRDQSYDLVIHFGQWERLESMIVGLAKGKYKIGFKTEGQYKHWVYDKWIEHPKEEHELHCFLKLVELLNIQPGPDGKNLEFWLTDDDKEYVKGLFKELSFDNTRSVIFHPGCGVHGAPREWAVSNYIKLGNKILDEVGEITIILTGSEIERKKCDMIQKQLGKASYSVAGETNIGQTAALLQNADLLVSGNTGIMHLATALGTKVIALHGPTSSQKWGPYDNESVVMESPKGCSPCLYLGFEYGCHQPDCMKLITVEQVFDKMVEILRR